MKFTHLFRNLLFILVILLTFGGCGEKPAGFGVLLWLEDTGADQESAADSPGGLLLKEGEIYPVYAESNLRDTYNLVPPKTGEFEVTRWRMEFFSSENDARNFAASYDPYRNIYGETKRSGQAIRAAADSNSERIYRLRVGQIVKVLEKLPQEVTEGSLTDYWYRVLTEDGTKGFCFGGNLEIFDREIRASQANKIEVDPALANFLGKPFYPEEFQKMIRERRINLKVLTPQVGTFPNMRDNKITIVTPEKTFSFSFDAIIPREPGRYVFGNSGLEVTITGTNTVSLRYPDGGSSVTQIYAAIDNIAEVIEAEAARQAALLEDLYYMGPAVSSAYGTISFESLGGAFVWENYNRLVPGVIPQGAAGSGTVEILYYPRQDLRSQYQGILSFRFRSSQEPVHFLYEKTAQGLRMVHVPPRDIQDGQVSRVNPSSMVMFFAAGSPRERIQDES